jgi:aspartate aminotransferase
VIVPDPEWPPTVGNVLCARAVAVACPLREELGWRWDLDELASKVTDRTRAIYVNSPNNPSGGMLTPDDLQQIASLAERRGLWIISDEAYEDVTFDTRQVSIAPLARPLRTVHPDLHIQQDACDDGATAGLSGYVRRDIAERMKKVLFYTAGNIPTVVQYGGIGASREANRSRRILTELKARDLFYDGIVEVRSGVLKEHRRCVLRFLRSTPRGSRHRIAISPSWR